MLPPTGSIDKEHTKTQILLQLRRKPANTEGILAFDLESVKAYSIEIAIALLPSPSDLLTSNALLPVSRTVGFRSLEY